MNMKNNVLTYLPDGSFEKKIHVDVKTQRLA